MFLEQSPYRATVLAGLDELAGQPAARMAFTTPSEALRILGAG
jgi:hypothetical protein